MHLRFTTNILLWLESFATKTSVYLVSKPICIATFYWYFFCINSEICKDILEHTKSDVNCGGIKLALKDLLVRDVATWNNTLFARLHFS